MQTIDTQVCWNHETREAVCRCLGCNRSFCRECVTEHEGRLLCASCFAAAIPAKAARTGSLRKFAPAFLVAAGLLIAWLAYWGFGETVIGLFRRNVLSGPASHLSAPPSSRSLDG